MNSIFALGWHFKRKTPYVKKRHQLTYNFLAILKTLSPSKKRKEKRLAHKSHGIRVGFMWIQ
jgi:hypothetical protein